MEGSGTVSGKMKTELLKLMRSLDYSLKYVTPREKR